MSVVPDTAKLHAAPRDAPAPDGPGLAEAAPAPCGFPNPLFDVSLDAQIVIDARGVVLDWNRAATDLFFYAGHEVRGRRIVDLIVPPEQRAHHARGLAGYLATGEAQVLDQTLEVEAIRKDGKRINIVLTVSRLPGAGEPMFLGSMRDMTRWQSEVERREVHRRFKALVEQLPVVVFTDAADAHLTPLYVSPQIEVLLGYTPEEWLHDTDVWESRLHPDDKGFVLQAVVDTPYGTDFVLEYRLLHKDGSVVWVREETVTIFGDDGEPLYSQGIFIDITERKRDADRAREAETRYRSLVEHTPAITFRTKTSAFEHISYASPQLKTILGYAPEDWIADPDLLLDRIHADDYESVASAHRESVATGKPINLEYRQGTPTGDFVWISITVDLIHCDAGEPLYWQGIMTDISERRKIEDAYAVLRDRYRHFADNASDAIVAVDLDSNILFSNPAFERMLGYDQAELRAMRLTDVLEESSLDTAIQLADSLLDGDYLPTARTTFNAHTKRGDVIVTEASVSLLSEGDRVLGFQAIVRDVTERVELEERLAFQAFHDDLTGLPNRAMLLERLQAWEDRPRSEIEAQALIFLDLDNFKVINDSLGHDVGDQALVAVGAKIRRALDPDDFIARFGGDEFVVLLSAASGAAAAERVANRLLKLFDEPLLVAGREINVTASFGIALLSDAMERPDELLRRADLAMYRSKASGRNRYVFHSPEMDQVALDRLELEADLRRALERDELSIVYQPVVDLQTGRTVGAESLVRWNHPQRGRLMPGEFIPIAEESGLIVALDRWMVRNALEQVCCWPAEAFGSGFCLSVNISARQLDHPDFDMYVDEALSACAPMPALRLVLELTETAMLQNIDHARDTLDRLNARGVRMALDDFGMGYSSLAQIRSLPIEYIKIDRQFTAEICKRHEDQVIVEGMIDLSHALGLTVVAEGVESEEQARAVAAFGADYAQGYYFSHPVGPRDIALRLLRESRNGGRNPVSLEVPARASA